MNILRKKTINLAVAEAFLQSPTEINLSNYTKIEQRGARHLANHFDEELLLIGIDEIDHHSARELKSFPGRISCPNLTFLDDQTAHLLASFEFPPICNTVSGGQKIGNYLGPLTKEKVTPILKIALQTGVIHTSCYLSITPPACEEIIKISNPAIFAQVRELDLECAKILADKKDLSFLKLTEISLDTAEVIVSKNCQSLKLPFLEDVSDVLLRIFLTDSIKFLDLSAVAFVTDKMCENFANRKTPIFLSLDGIKSLSSIHAKCLMKCGYSGESSGTLNLRGIEEIDDELGQILCQYQGMALTLGSYVKCSTETRKMLENTSRIHFQDSKLAV